MKSDCEVGDYVEVQLFNSKEGSFYGPRWFATILEINWENRIGDGSLPWYAPEEDRIRPFKVNRPGYSDIWIKPKEVLRHLRSHGEGQFFDQNKEEAKP
jgi:hypothetical protein